MWTITLFLSLLFKHYPTQYATGMITGEAYEVTPTYPPFTRETTPERPTMTTIHYTTPPERPTTPTVHYTTTPKHPTTTQGDCFLDDFKLIGGQCLFIDHHIQGNWQMMRSVCNDLGGDFPNFADANLLADVSEYIHANGLDTASFWAGSNDLVVEGMWQWINNRSEVKRGTPLWGDLSDRRQQPTGGTLENCGALLKEDHYFMHDVPCSSSLSLICEEFRREKVTGRQFDRVPRNGEGWPEAYQATTTEHYSFGTTSTENYPTRSPTTEHHPTEPTTTEHYPTEPTTTDHYPTVCPEPYEMIGGKCLYANTLATNTWDSHVITCQNLGGHMVKLDDANLLGSLFDHLTLNGIYLDFWIGANDKHQENQWHWHDKTPVRLGTPFWGDDGTTIQNPDGSIEENCGYISHDDHYFFDDAVCETARYVICQIDLWD